VAKAVDLFQGDTTHILAIPKWGQKASSDWAGRALKWI
jgi:hypothetical protein